MGWNFTAVPQYKRALGRELNIKNLATQIARSMFDVTAYHKFAGGVVGYTTDPQGAAMQVRKDLDMCDVRHFVQVNSLVAGTGTPMPMLLSSNQPGDVCWLESLEIPNMAPQFARVKVLFEAFMTKLRDLSGEICKRNQSGKREHPFAQMDPLILERSVSL